MRALSFHEAEAYLQPTAPPSPHAFPVHAVNPRGHLHALLTQCPLPYRDPKSPVWSLVNGRYTIIIAGGYVAGPNGTAIALGVPYGSRARLLLAHIQTYAVRHRTPVIPVGASFSGFVKSLGFRVSGGANGSLNAFREQTLRLAASSWTFASANPETETVDNHFARLMGGIELFYRRETGELRLSKWPREIHLTDAFYEHLREHACPFDLIAYSQLSSNARAMDIYCWLAHRLRRIPRDRPLVLTVAQLAQQFAIGVHPGTHAGSHILAALDLALSVYPWARVTRERVCQGRSRVWRVTFAHSLPPIAAACQVK